MSSRDHETRLARIFDNGSSAAKAYALLGPKRAKSPLYESRRMRFLLRSDESVDTMLGCLIGTHTRSEIMRMIDSDQLDDVFRNDTRSRAREP